MHQQMIPAGSVSREVHGSMQVPRYLFSSKVGGMLLQGLLGDRTGAGLALELMTQLPESQAIGVHFGSMH